MVDDKLLINGIKQRDSKVYNLVFSYYYSGLCVYANRLLKDADLSEDVVQSVFLKLWERADQLTITTSIRNYLMSMVRNRSIDYLKHRQVTEKHREEVHTGCLEALDESPFYAEAEVEELFLNAMEKLPARCREIFRLSRIQNVSNQDIAEQLNLSKRTVELQISNALKILRKELKPLFPFWIIVKLTGVL
jgi:RNA polymerase sigma-70 factor (ECF subfamily)